MWKIIKFFCQGVLLSVEIAAYIICMLFFPQFVNNKTLDSMYVYMTDAQNILASRISNCVEGCTNVIVTFKIWFYPLPKCRKEGQMSYVFIIGISLCVGVRVKEEDGSSASNSTPHSTFYKY